MQKDKSFNRCLRDDEKGRNISSTLPDEQKSLRFILLTSFLLILISCYLYPNLFQRPNKRHSKMMSSRSSRYSNFAGAISEKLDSDRYWLEGDKSHWYHVEASKIENSTEESEAGSSQIMSKFRLRCDRRQLSINCM